MTFQTTVIDLFAGPGGLGEGFSAFRTERSHVPFRIALSVEKELSAHRTLELRAFFRQFDGEPPQEYYEYLRGQLSKEELYKLYPRQKYRASQETLGGPRALGDNVDDLLIRERIRELNNSHGPFVVIGGPPCQAYSLIGRVKNRSLKGYEEEKDNRHYLYREYLKVLLELRPEVFVMENVRGILSSAVGGKLVFPRLIEDLSYPSGALGKTNGGKYNIFSLIDNSPNDMFGGTGSDYVIKCEQYGVPQSRHRVILIGVREDIQTLPTTLKGAGIQTVKNVIHDLPSVRSGLSKGGDSFELWFQALQKESKIVARELGKQGHDPSIVDGAIQSASRIRSRGSKFLKRKKKFRGNEELLSWFTDKNLNGVTSHETRGHMAGDLARYLYCSCFAILNDGRSPRAEDFPIALKPNHANWGTEKFVDRFKVQVGDRPASTITSHIAKDGHYFIHYDPSQCRSLTVREAARIQTFPDNYHFEGTRTQQYTQVGNAVPPFLSHRIAEIVYGILNG